MDILDWLDTQGTTEAHAARDEIERLRRDCAEAYQVVGAISASLLDSESNPPEEVTKALDNLSAAANGEPRPHDDLLPFTWQPAMRSDSDIGEKRTLRESACSCGQPVLIEYNAHSCRADKKRIFYPDQDDAGWCVFRCKRCHQPVSETVPGAEYGVPHSNALNAPPSRADAFDDTENVAD